MQVSHAIRERRSIRAFLPDPVSAEVVRQIIDLAKWSPSWANAQDWNAYVLTGDVLDRLKEAYALLAAENADGAPDLPSPPREWPGYLAERMVSRRVASEASESGDGNTDARSIWRFYGAPALVLFAVDAALEPTYACFDAGLLVSAFTLAAEDRGFSTCVMATAVRHADVLHELIPEAEGKHFVVGAALGSADLSSVINRGERNRVSTDEIALFYGDAQ
jgi:nitroreductase